MYKKMLVLTCTVMPMVFTPVYVHADESVWAGEAELGGLQTSGNTQTRTLNAATKGSYMMNHWRFTLGGGGTSATDRGVTTAEHYQIDGEVHYSFTNNFYGLSTVGYDKDRFNGYDYRLNETLGVGYHIFNSDVFDLAIETGLGFRQSQLANKLKEKDIVSRSGLNAKWQVNPMVKLTEEADLVGGKRGTVYQTKTALVAMLSNVLAAKFSYKTKTNSKPILGTKRTDTESAVNLVYSF